MFKFFKKHKKAVRVNEIDVREQTRRAEDVHKDLKTLGDLANSGHLFFRNLNREEALKKYMQNIFPEKSRKLKMMKNFYLSLQRKPSLCVLCMGIH